MTSTEKPSPFIALLQEQVAWEFEAQQQYVALAVWFDAHDLPQLAKLFYQQAVEERNHGMMMVQYLLDRDVAPVIPAVERVRNTFDKPAELIDLAVAQEQDVTTRIEGLFKTARDSSDFMGEQFMLWFLKEQVEEVSSMTTLQTILERAGHDLFQVEDFVAREMIRAMTTDPTAPPVAGGALTL